MSRETLSRVLNEAASLGVMKLGLTGGEPTLYPDLEGVIREAKHLGFWVSLKTHGVLSSRRLHALWEAGLNRIVVSLHGLAKVHDSFTGVSKSFEKTMAIVEDALALGIQVEVSITVTAVNRNEIVPLIAALEHLELDINVSHVVSDRHDGVEIPIRLKLSHDEWMEYFSSLPDHLRPETVDSLSFKCGCATSNFAITHTGQVQPCISVPWCAGSVHEQSLQEIWVNSPVFQEIRGYGRDDFSACNSCPVQGACFRHPSNLISSGHAYTGKNPEQCVQAEALSEFERLRSSARHAALPVIPNR